LPTGERIRLYVRAAALSGASVGRETQMEAGTQTRIQDESLRERPIDFGMGGPTSCVVPLDRPRRLAEGYGVREMIERIDLAEMEVEFDVAHKALWCWFAYSGRPSFRPPVVSDLNQIYDGVRQCFTAAKAGEEPLQYIVWGSRMPGVWNLGGDLGLFAQLIRERNRDGLRRYAVDVTNAAYGNHVCLDLPLVTVALIQGDALGGGFEGVLSNNVIVAERSAKFGFPEILFNLFPGMGAYSFLARRITPALAERMIVSGRIHGAEELYELGVVDVLAEDGQGEQTVRRYLQKCGRAYGAHRAIYQARHRINPVSYDEMIEIAEIWVDTALKLEESDLRKMMRLVAAQDRRRAQAIDGR
jgi:DSF synthase